MNSLERDIVPGEVVIVGAGHTPIGRVADRRFKCYAGFGLSAATAGRMIVGRWMSDEEPAAINGSHIDVDETAAYQRQHGRGP